MKSFFFFLTPRNIGTILQSTKIQPANFFRNDSLHDCSSYNNIGRYLNTIENKCCSHRGSQLLYYELNQALILMISDHRHEELVDVVSKGSKS